jgi:hypothetical protein
MKLVRCHASRVCQVTGEHAKVGIRVPIVDAVDAGPQASRRVETVKQRVRLDKVCIGQLDDFHRRISKPERSGEIHFGKSA